MAKPFKPGEGMIHGLYAHSQPAEAVAAVLREDITGIEEQIIGMRVLGRGLQERMDRVSSRKEAVRLGQAYTLAADLSTPSRRLVEEIAATRYVLRNTFALAMETEEDEEFVHLVEIYSIACNRLLGLLRWGWGTGTS